MTEPITGDLQNELIAVRVTLSNLDSNVARLATQSAIQNGRIDKLEHENLIEMGRAEVRKEWQQTQAASFRWVFLTGLAAAGVLSGVIFGIADRILQ